MWSNGDQAKVILPIPQGGAAPKQLKLNLRAFVSPLHPKQDAVVFIDQMPPQATSFTNADHNTWTLDLPPDLSKKKYLELQFHFKNPASPKDVGGVPGDDRKLGVGLISAQFQ